MLKSSCFAEVNSFKNKHLSSYPNDVSISNSERLIKQLQDNSNFVREQFKNNDEIMNSLLQELSNLMIQLFGATMKQFHQIQMS